MSAKKPLRRRFALTVEALESRLAPATINGTNTVVSYTDVDGDAVTVTCTKAILSLGQFTFTPSGSGEQLQVLDLSGVTTANNGLGLTWKAVRGATGDGLVNVGRINATGIDLGTIKLPGDLAAIDAGDVPTTTAGLASLTVQSLGRFGTSTGSPDLESNIVGALTKLTVRSDIVDALIDVTGGADGKIGTAAIGGSLIGLNGAGVLETTGDMTKVTIGGDVRGGTNIITGEIACGGKIGTLTIGGSLVAGSDTDAGSVVADAIGTVKVGGDVRGDTTGSGAIFVGVIWSSTTIGNVTIGGSLIGATGGGSLVSGGNMGLVKIAGSLRGGTGAGSGSISCGGTLAGVTIGGSIFGGTATTAGSVTSSGSMGAVKVAGDLVGGSATGAGSIATTSFPAKIASVGIGGSVVGGSADGTGSIGSAGDLGPVSIGVDLIGSSISGSASLTGAGAIGAQSIKSVTIGGSVIAGSDTSSGTLAGSGAIQAINDIGAITIKGSLLGNDTNPALITARGQLVATATKDVAIGSLTVNGRVEFANILAGYTPFGTAANGNAQIGAVKVKGDWIASSLSAGVDAGGDNLFGTGDDVKITGGTISSIKSIEIAGQVQGTVGGADHYGFVSLKIGSFKVAGTSFALTPGASNDTAGLAVGATLDVTLKEVV